MEKLKTISLFSQNHSIAWDYMRKYEYPWEMLKDIKSIILEIGMALDNSYEKIGDNVWISKTAKVAPTASITGPCIIDEYAEIRHCAFIRGSAIIGKKCVIGNSVEVKNAIISDESQVPHFNYVGDSVLGYHSHMGAGSITSNVKSDKTNVTVACDGAIVETGLRKFGAMLGDNVEVGCNSVLCPGSVIGRNTNIYPLTRVRGYIPENCIVKSPENIVPKREDK